MEKYKNSLFMYSFYSKDHSEVDEISALKYLESDWKNIQVLRVGISFHI